MTREVYSGLHPATIWFIDLSYMKPKCIVIIASMYWILYSDNSKHALNTLFSSINGFVIEQGIFS